MDYSDTQYTLFEYVFVDPKAIWEDPDLLRSLSLKYGHILVQNFNNKIWEQIRNLSSFDEENAEHQNELRDIRYALSALESKGLFEAYELGAENNSKLPKFIEDARQFLGEEAKGFCLVSKAYAAHRCCALLPPGRDVRAIYEVRLAADDRGGDHAHGDHALT